MSIIPDPTNSEGGEGGEGGRVGIMIVGLGGANGCTVSERKGRGEGRRGGGVDVMREFWRQGSE